MQQHHQNERHHQQRNNPLAMYHICGHTHTRTTQTIHHNAATMALFIHWITTTESLVTIATCTRVHSKTLHRQFTWCWWIIPTPTINPPLIAVIDGGQGAYSAIRSCWLTTIIQRCLVHTQRVVRRHTTSGPRTPAGQAIYQLARTLTQITTVDHAIE